MLLKSFHVRVFRNVIDSGLVEVDRSTCLVGKNEAGKSAIIEALHRLNPAKPVALALLDDYPRWLKKEHEITGVIADAVPITATFSLTDDELKSFEARFGSGVLATRDVVAKRKYEGDMVLELPINQGGFVRSFTQAHCDPSLLSRVSQAATSQELLDTLTKVSTETTPESKEPTSAAQAAKETKAQLEKYLAGAKTLTDAVNAFIRPLIPKTFYFSEYSQLRGRYNLNEVVPALKGGSADEEIQAAADFLKLARMTSGNVEAWDFEQSNAELEAISSLLTRRVKENWKQNQHLKLAARIEVANAQGERHLQFRVEDTRHDFSNRLDRRSTGFRWFVSFIASFFEFQTDKNLILLLDEPGLSLHARAQKDLLDAIDTTLAAGRQIVYTTHSPFMVRTDALNRVRIVEDRGPDVGATVTNDAGAISDPDTLFPLQAALGYDIAQNLFIGNRNILLEGTSDFIYLTTLSSHLASVNRPGLPNDCRLLPAGGATNIPTFIVLLGGKVDMVVLLDGKAQRQRIDTAIAQGRLKASSVLRVEQFCSVKNADIEDLFEPAEYLSMYNATFGTVLTEAQLHGQDRIVKRIERAVGEFDHARVAARFLSHQNEFIVKLSSDTIRRFESVIEALTKALP